MKKLLFLIAFCLVAVNCFGAYPTTGILDNFNRANEGPPPSASWSDLYGLGADYQLKVVSNQAVPNALDPANDRATNYWNPTTFGPDCEVYCTIATETLIDIGEIGLWVRATGVGSIATVSGYYVEYDRTTGGDHFDVIRVDNEAETQLGASISQELSAGDSFGVSMIGDTITVWYKSGAGAWTNIGERTDSTYQDAGYIGIIWWDSTDGVLDNFGGGTYVPPPYDDSQVIFFN